MFLLPRVYDNSSVNNSTLVSFALSPYFDRDGIHNLRTTRLIFKQNIPRDNVFPFQKSSLSFSSN